MGFLQKKSTWTNAELIPLKTGIAVAYLILGSLFSETVNRLIGLLSVIFVLSIALSLYWWITKMKKEN